MHDTRCRDYFYFRRNCRYTKTKHLFVKTAQQSLFLQQENKNFTQKKVLRISQKDAQNVEKNADKTIEKNWMMQFVLNVELKQKFHLGQNQIEKFYVKHVLMLQKNNKKERFEFSKAFFFIVAFLFTEGGSVGCDFIIK